MRHLAVRLGIAALLVGCSSSPEPPGPDAARADVVTGADVATNRPDVTGSDVVTAPDAAGLDSGARPDVVQTDARAPRDVAARDASVTPTPGAVFCFTSGNCSGATPLCCDSSTRGDAGRVFTDTCISATAACGTPGNVGNTFACDDGPDCTGTQVCCATTGTSTSGTAFLSGTVCAASCTGAMMQQLCSSDGDCGSGRHCTPMHVSGRDVGYCM